MSDALESNSNGNPQFHRVTLQITRGEIDDKFVFDLLLTPDKFPVKQLTYFGFYGTISSEKPHKMEAFIVRKSGRMDYGSDCDEEYRYGKTNILTKKIKEGEYATINYPTGDFGTKEMTGKITHVHDLAMLTAKNN